jgi:two-component system, NtrC family, nitrogen regulation sensor histidine kinase NtrY
MNSLRARLVLIFVLATLVPVAGTVWLTQALVEHSLSYTNLPQVDRLSRLLEKTGREYYQHARDALKADAAAGRIKPQHRPATGEDEAERFDREGSRLQYLVRKGDEVLVYERDLGNVGLDEIRREVHEARTVLEDARARDLRRGFFVTSLLVGGSIWLLSLTLLVFLADRFVRPIRQLTAGLSALAGGDHSVRLPPGGDDEVGAAIQAFNGMAGQLQQSRERLVYLTQVASWQALARKMAHEVKNSLTPIRLNVEEMVARAGQADRQFLEQASQIITEEIGVLERRIRAFSDLAMDPPVNRTEVDLNAAVEERVEFLSKARPGTHYETDLEADPVRAHTDADLLRGILTNLMENAGQAAGAGGTVLLRTRSNGAQARIEIHDSGPGLSAEARASLFEPTISFKKGGMGLGLSIARKSALACGGDIVPMDGALGGAAFGVHLPLAS